MTLLDAQDLTKSYGPRVVLDGVHLSVAEGERVGLVGLNGAGKSTLARILAGVEEPDHGTLALRRGARVLYLAQEPALDPARSALEHVAAQASAAHEAEAMLSQLGLRDPQAVVRGLSGGERRRVALAGVLVAQPELLILDEPTNHLDIETIEWLEQHLERRFRGALLLVTHDRYLLDRVTRRTVEVHDGQLTSYQGGYATYLEAKAEREALAERTEANRQNFLRRELAWLRRSPAARSTKQKARVQRAEQALQADGPGPARKLDMAMTHSRTGKTILDAVGLCVDAPDGRRLVRDLNLHLTRGQRLGIVGPNGCGKTTLLRTLLGDLPPAAGRVVRGKNAQIAYLSQLREGLDPDATILDNVTGGRSHVRLGTREVHAMSYLERFLFRSHQAKQPVRSLSGGERTRVALAKLLKDSANLVVLDEPTNDLDVTTLAALEELICELEGTALVVTHDRWFLDRIATGVLWFEQDGAVTCYAGDYGTVKALRAQAERAARVDADATEPDKARRRPRPPKARKPGLTYKEARELEGIEAQIEHAEAQAAGLEAKLASPEAYKDQTTDIAALVSERDHWRAEAERLMARWEELEEKKAQAAAPPRTEG